MKIDLETMAAEVSTQIQGELKESLAKSLRDSAAHEVGSCVRSVVKEFLNEEVVPHVTAYLLEHKDGLLKVASEAARGLCESLSEKCFEQAKETLAQDYNRRDLLTKLFKGY